MLKLLITLTFALTTIAASAHELRPAIADIKGVQVEDKARIELEIAVNLEAILAGIGPEHTDSTQAPEGAVYETLRMLPPDQLAQKYQSGDIDITKQVVLHDGTKPILIHLDGLDIPSIGDVSLARETTIRMSAQVNSDVKPTFSWSADLGPIVIRATNPDGSDGYAGFLTNGAKTPELVLIAEQNGFFGRLRGLIKP